MQTHIIGTTTSTTSISSQFCLPACLLTQHALIHTAFSGAQSASQRPNRSVHTYHKEHIPLTCHSSTWTRVDLTTELSWVAYKTVLVLVLLCLRRPVQNAVEDQDHFPPRLVITCLCRNRFPGGCAVKRNVKVNATRYPNRRLHQEVSWIQYF